MPQHQDRTSPNRTVIVHAHLRKIAERVSAAGDIETIRAIIDDYSAVDASVLALSAEARYVEADGVPCEWLLAENSDPNFRLLYVHGGSWMSGSLAGYRPHVSRLARATGCSVLNVGYRLAPEAPFPGGLNDCHRVFQWLQRHGPQSVGQARATF